MEERKFDPGVIQPGMERVIETGETLEITDANGQVFAITATEGPKTMEFITAFDNWLTMKKAKVQGPVFDAAEATMMHKFYSLPLRVQRELPSFKTLGAKV